MFYGASMTSVIRASPESLKRVSLVLFYGLVHCENVIPLLCKASAFAKSLHFQPSYGALSIPVGKWLHVRYMRNASVGIKADGETVRFSLNKQCDGNRLPMEEKKGTKRVKMSKKAKRNELRFYRLKAKKKINSPSPEVRIRYKLEKAKRKEAWLIEKLTKFELPKAPAEAYDPEILTDEERHYLKRTGEKKKNYVQVGRRGVFGGVVLNMHLHWKKHETVKVVCKPCEPGKIHEYAEVLAQLSKGIVIDINPSNTIIFYRGKNYVQPEVISPPDTLSKDKASYVPAKNPSKIQALILAMNVLEIPLQPHQNSYTTKCSFVWSRNWPVLQSAHLYGLEIGLALEKYRYEQSLEHTGWFIEKLEKELEAYYEHVAQYKKGKEDAQPDSSYHIRESNGKAMDAIYSFGIIILVKKTDDMAVFAGQSTGGRILVYGSHGYTFAYMPALSYEGKKLNNGLGNRELENELDLSLYSLSSKTSRYAHFGDNQLTVYGIWLAAFMLPLQQRF
ncbi:CRM domain-containing protein [Citrus sinensis]|uniref:CRM domain-containing protein n=1 Tax=Citrus sinensis TaxID=2711 RepID=A0ACB8JHB4_CITSI|nr:CRM domain-containing protein [Citrus sinensis]